MLNIINDAFSSQGWQAEPIPERDAVRATFRGRHSEFQVFVMSLPEQGLLRVAVVNPLAVPAAQTAAVAELLHRLNATLPIGAFELDYDRASVRTTAALDIGDGTLVASMVVAMVQRCLTAADEVWPELVAVAEGRMTPRSALLHSRAEVELASLRPTFAASGGELTVGEVSDDQVIIVSTPALPAAEAERLCAALSEAIDAPVKIG
jgi:hypothetical protein